jgi:hypothetical protein
MALISLAVSNYLYIIPVVLTLQSFLLGKHSTMGASALKSLQLFQMPEAGVELIVQQHLNPKFVFHVSLIKCGLM